MHEVGFRIQCYEDEQFNYPAPHLYGRIILRRQRGKNPFDSEKATEEIKERMKEKWAKATDRDGTRVYIKTPEDLVIEFHEKVQLPPKLEEGELADVIKDSRFPEKLEDPHRAQSA